MKIVFLLSLLATLTILLDIVRSLKTFPHYFCDNTMRVVPGADADEFHIELLALIDGCEIWRYHQTVYGWRKVILYIERQEKTRREARDQSRRLG